MTSLWSVLNALGVLRVSNSMIFTFSNLDKIHSAIILVILLLLSNRGNSKGNSETDGYRRIDHLSCEKPFAGIIAILRTLAVDYIMLVAIFFWQNANI